MKALLSGQAAAAVVLHKHPLIIQIGRASWIAKTQYEAVRVFDGCHDVLVADVKDDEDAELQLRRMRALDRVLRFFLFLIDPEEPEGDLPIYAERVSALSEEYNLRETLREKLSANPLPVKIHVDAVLKACVNAPIAREIFQWLIDTQAWISRVAGAFDGIPLSLFNSEHDRVSIRNKLVSTGIFYAAATELSQSADLSFLRLRAINDNRGSRNIISTFFDELQKVPEKAELEEYSNEADVDSRWNSYEKHQYSDPEVFRQVILQQHAITDRLRKADSDGARWLMNEMIKSQSHSSTPDQIAKSYSSMAQKAKLYDCVDLQLEWSRNATDANPYDPITYGHLADALLRTHNFPEAQAAFDKAREAGDILFADTGNARVLRSMGRLREAHSYFVEVSERNSENPEVVFTELGAADTLREMGYPAKALDAYRSLSQRFPLEPSVWAGITASLIDLGQLDQASREIGKRALDDDGIYAKVTRARILQIAGKFDEALRLQDEVLRLRPNNLSALCGKARTFELKGEIEQSLLAFEIAADKAPYSPDPVIGKANLLLRARRFKEALALYDFGRVEFAFDYRFIEGSAATLSARGRNFEALQTCDEAIIQHPTNAKLKLIRARALERMGCEYDALQQFNHLIDSHTRLADAILGKGAILIKLGRLEEATMLLSSNKLETRHDWRRFGYSALLLRAKGHQKSAQKNILRHLAFCPFAKERTSLRNILVSLELERSRPIEAYKIVESAPAEIDNLIAFHAYAAARQMDLAKDRLGRIKSGDEPATVVELAEEIARRHRIVSGHPIHGTQWIRTRESDYLLTGAA